MERGSDAVKDRRGRFSGSRAGLEIGFIAVVALAVRLVDLGYPPFIDELHHLLAAGSLLETGVLTIHDGGAYTRGLLFTYLVAGSMGLFGQSLEVARLPAVLSGVLLVCLLFAWLRARVGRIAAWTAGLLLCFAPISIYLSQQVRFYSLHALFFWLGVFGLYRLVDRTDPPSRRPWVGLGSAAAFLFAYHLQITTIIGLAGVALFVFLVESPRIFDAVRRSRHRWLIAGATGVGIGLLVAAATLAGAVDILLDRATRVDFWAVERAGNPRFYHWLLTDQYSFLYVLFPFAGLLALANRWKAGLLFTVVFGVALVGHSIAAWKAERFLFYAMPAFFAVWGMAAQETLPWLWDRLSDRGRASLGRVPAIGRRTLAGLALFCALAFAATGPTAYTTTRLIFLQGVDWSRPPGHTGEWYRGHPDWEAAVPHLSPLVDSVQVVVGEPDMKLVYYLGDLDYIIYAGNLVGMSSGAEPVRMNPEFTAWPKVGRPLMSRPESVEIIMTCYATGLLVAEKHVWGWRWGVPRETAEFIEQNMRPVELPDDTGILAFRWERPEPEPALSARCEQLERTRREAPVP